MKNLLIYITPTKSFDYRHPNLENDAELLAKVQIDSILDMGWRKEDVLFFTNFDYEYKGIKSEVLTGVEFVERKPQVSKINAIVRLFETGRIKDELYWFHDLDAFQMVPFQEEQIRREMGMADLGVTYYGNRRIWNTGTIFFRSSSRDIFEHIQKLIRSYSVNEEQALLHMTNHRKDFSIRVKRMNPAYNFLPWNLETCYAKAIKPIKVAHFHPFAEVKKLGIPRLLDFYKGENQLNVPLITDRLVKIFGRYGIK